MTSDSLIRKRRSSWLKVWSCSLSCTFLHTESATIRDPSATWTTKGDSNWVVNHNCFTLSASKNEWVDPLSINKLTRLPLILPCSRSVLLVLFPESAFNDISPGISRVLSNYSISLTISVTSKLTSSSCSSPKRAYNLALQLCPGW